MPDGCLDGLGLAVEIRYEGQQRDVTSSLDRDRQLALVLGAYAGLPTGANLAAVADKTLEQANVLVIDRLATLATELTNLAARCETPPIASIIAHSLNLLASTYEASAAL
jgi:hypothetical protein